MKKITALFMSIILSMLILPAALSVLPDFKGENKEESFNLPEGDAVTTGSFDDDFKISVYNAAEDRLFEVNFEDYIVGVLAGEMPPTYHIEALKAQAVAARSYILARVCEYLEGNTSEEHKGAMVCTDYQHCKAWRDISEAKKNWDSRFSDDYALKMYKAVELTKGEYLTYDNKVAKAFFYAVSGGRTEDVEEVWGSSIPYLKSVESRGDIGSDGYSSVSVYPKDLFISKLREMDEKVKIDDLESCVESVTRTQGGGVKEIKIGGVALEGKKMREVFGLRSTNFELEFEGEKVIFDVKGYGHGVGMSQNGANVMAQDGKSYKSILKHYYTDVDIVNLYKKS